MRLRSPQIVFLFLLAFTGRVREDHALRLLAEPTLYAGQHREASESKAVDGSGLSFGCACSGQDGRLSPRALAEARTAWTMRGPALDSAAVRSHTGFRRV